ncbi:MAG: hemin receptor [Flavobacteriaceae bacterium]|nr:hemin receptor [Flavobacteriaceae bacterium]
MTKKISILAGISVSAMMFAQDVSVIRNTTEVYDNQSLIGSAKYSAMGGAMGALGGEISSMGTNPAGLGVFITNDSNVSLLVNSNQTEAHLAGNSIKKSVNNTTLGQAGGVFSFHTNDKSSWKFINVGINYTNEGIGNQIQSPKNPNLKKPVLDNSNKITDYDLYSGHMYERIGKRSKLSFGIGGNYENNLYIGAGVNLLSSNIEQYDEVLITYQNSGSSNYYKRNFTPFREESTGVSLSLGVIGKITQQIRLGASVESPVWYSIDREYVEYKNDGQKISSYNYAEDRNLKTPSKLTLSGAFIPNKNFALNVDYRMDLGKPHFSGGDAERQLNDFYQSNYKSQSEVRLGGEYRLKNFRVRGGYSFTTSPFRDYTFGDNGKGYSIFNDDGTIQQKGKLSNYIVGKSEVISGGLGYDFKSFYIDAAYQYITYKYSNPFFDGDYFHTSATTDSNTSIVSNVKNNKGNFILTLGWKF